MGESPAGTAPLELVAQLADQCVRFAIIDVDAARGSGNNRELVFALMKQFRKSRNKVFIQVGGGIRGSDQAQYYLDNGATWLIVGTVLHSSPLAVEQLVARFGEHMTAAIDARQGEVLKSGRVGNLNTSLDDMASRVLHFGFKRILFTDIPELPNADPDFRSAKIIANTAKLPLFMAGSLRTLEHLNLAAKHSFLQGIMIDAHLAAAHADLLFVPACQET